MTNENISGFLNSIAEAKRAFDAEPEYQSRIAELERDKQRLGETVASRELRIHQLKQDQETLTQRLRSAEVERDDAGFRALEEADRVSALLTLMRQFVGDGLKAISAVEGQEQIVVSRAMIDAKEAEVQEWKVKALDDAVALQQLRDDMRLAQEQLQRPFAPTPVHDTSSSPGDTTDPYFKPYEWPNDMPSQGQTDGIGRQLVEGQSEPKEGQRVDNPTPEPQVGWPAAMPEGQSDGPFASNVTIGNIPEPVIVSSTSAESETSAVSSASQTPPERNRDESTRFKGRKHYDVTYFVPLHEWLLKGGTREDYEWRPLPEANRVYSS